MPETYKEDENEQEPVLWTAHITYALNDFFGEAPVYATERDGSGGGFLLAWEDFGRMFDQSFPACAISFFFFSFFKRRLARAH